MQEKKITAAFRPPTRRDIVPGNLPSFDALQREYGVVPNLYAFLAWSETALKDYLQLDQRNSSLSPQQKDIINLVTSQANNSDHCLRVYTMLSLMDGFSEAEIIQIRKADIQFNAGYQALAAFVQEVLLRRGHVSLSRTKALLAAGYSRSDLVDIILAIGDRIITNYLFGITQTHVEWPEVLDL